MFSKAVSRVTFLLDTVSIKGYKLTITKSIVFILSSLMVSICDSSFLLAKMPAWIFGWRVLTLPPRISGNFVKFDT